jgi:signal transduction histidine kinase
MKLVTIIKRISIVSTAIVFLAVLAGCGQRAVPAPRSPFPVPRSLCVTFTISDTGIGIRGEDIDKLFIDYNQVDILAHREIEGTGLG